MNFESEKLFVLKLRKLLTINNINTSEEVSLFTSSTPIFLHASRKLSTLRRHLAIVNLG